MCSIYGDLNAPLRPSSILVTPKRLGFAQKVTQCHQMSPAVLFNPVYTVAFHGRYAKLKTVPLMLHPRCVPVQMPNFKTLVEVASQMMN